MKRKTVMGVPVVCSYVIIAVCVLGIIIGSFCDLRINEALANVNDIGTFFAQYGLSLSFALYPAAGACLYVGFMKKGERYRLLAHTMLILGLYLGVYYANSYLGKYVRARFGYTPGESPVIISVLCWLLWVVLYGCVSFVMIKILDDSDPDRLIAVGAAIIIAGVTADCTFNWLKQVGSRPRYKYLITLDDPAGEFRNWWQMIPNLAGNNDGYKSWPSGHMTVASSFFALPLLVDVCKNRSDKKNMIAFAVTCVYIIIGGYNRIHMTNHFLSDVCFGTLITYLIFVLITEAFVRAAEK